MDRNWFSGLAAMSDGDHSLGNPINRNRLNGLATVFIGISQLPLAFIFMDHWLSLFVIGSGGWLLIGIGVNVFRGREAFEIGWSGSDRVEWLNTAVIATYAIAVVAATVFTILAS